MILLFINCIYRCLCEIIKFTDLLIPNDDHACDN